MKRVRVMHFITGVDVGGAERLLLSVLGKVDRGRFDVAVCYWKGTGALRGEFAAEGIRVIALPEAAHSTFWKAVALYRLLRSDSTMILHTHMIHATLIGRVMGTLAGVPVILTTEHNTSNWRRKYYLINLVYRWTARKSQVILAISEAVRRCLIDIGKIDPRKIQVMHDAVDLERFRPCRPDLTLKAALGLESSSGVIGCLSRLEQRKGLQFLVGAVRMLKVRHPDVRLIFVGEGPSRNSLEELVRTYQLQANVVFAGLQADIVRYLALFDVCVLPSLHEGLSIALIEALAMEKPVVATSVGGIPEVVSDGVEGLVVPPRDEEALARSIGRILEDRVLARRMGEAGRRKAELQFDLGRHVERLEQLYLSLLPQEA